MNRFKFQCNTESSLSIYSSMPPTSFYSDKNCYLKARNLNKEKSYKWMFSSVIDKDKDNIKKKP